MGLSFTVYRASVGGWRSFDHAQVVDPPVTPAKGKWKWANNTELLAWFASTVTPLARHDQWRKGWYRVVVSMRAWAEADINPIFEVTVGEDGLVTQVVPSYTAGFVSLP